MASESKGAPAHSWTSQAKKGSGTRGLEPQACVCNRCGLGLVAGVYVRSGGVWWLVRMYVAVVVCAYWSVCE